MSTHTGVGTGTYSVKAGEIQRDWHVIDANGLVLGRLAAEVARILRGKTKPTYSTHLDVGDHVVIINADKVAVTGRKMTDKMYYWHTMYPGGFREKSMRDMMAKHSDRVIERAVRGMLPKTKLGRAMIKKLKVYAGPGHPHAAQNPQPLELAHTRLR
jgi:large subunit ribosomal protein L13